MLENYTSCDLTIKEIADKAFISEVYFRKLFKESYGTSPQKYLIELRINNAKTLIATADGKLHCAWESGPEIGLYRDIRYQMFDLKELVRQ